MTRPFKQQRGAASVEMAISMLVIIPVFTYALFLDDLLRYAADLQEAVVSTPWDFTIQDYTRPSEGGLTKNSPKPPEAGATMVQHNARLMFCDHESSGDGYTDDDCNQTTHHVGRALSGHVCWLNDNLDLAHQIACAAPDTSVGDFAEPTFKGYKNSFGNSGGLFKCDGKEIVENYLVPKTFMQEFSKVDLSKENWKNKGGDVHSNAQKGTEDTAYFLEQVNFAVVADPWAYNEKNSEKLDADPGTTSGPAWDRVSKVYKGTLAYGPAVAMTGAFLATAVGQGLLLNIAHDPVTTPNISFPKANDPKVSVDQGSGSRDYFSSPWRDAAYKNTNSARGNFYMGCTSAAGC